MSEKPLKNFTKQQASRVIPSDYIVKMKADDQSWAVRTLVRLFAFTVVATFAVIFFSGFNVLGFTLPYELVEYLGAAAIAEVASIVLAVLGYLFRSQIRSST